MRFQVLAQRVRHERRRDGAFNLFALERTVAYGNDLSVNTNTGRSGRHKQKITAATLDELGQPAIELGERRIGHILELSTEIRLTFLFDDLKG